MNWIESLLGTARSRLSNPLAGSFILSWTVINWKTVLILLSVETPNAEKIGLLMQADYFNYWNLLICPLVFGALLTVAIPLATWLLEMALNPIQVRRLKQMVDVTKMKAEIEKLNEEWGTYQNLKSNLENAQNEKNALDEELRTATKEIAKLSDKLKDVEDFERSNTDDVSPQDEELPLEESRKYEEWKKNALNALRHFMSEDITSESLEFADKIFNRIRDNEPQSFSDIKAKIRESAAIVKSIDFSKELVKLSNLLPSHPDEIPF